MGTCQLVDTQAWVCFCQRLCRTACQHRPTRPWVWLIPEVPRWVAPTPLSPCRACAEAWCDGGAEAFARLGPTAAWSHRPQGSGSPAWAANAGNLDGSSRRVAAGRRAVSATVMGHSKTTRGRLGEHSRARRRPRRGGTPPAARSVPAACAGGAVDSSHFVGSDAVHSHGVRQAGAGHAATLSFICVWV